MLFDGLIIAYALVAFAIGCVIHLTRKRDW